MKYFLLFVFSISSLVTIQASRAHDIQDSLFGIQLHGFISQGFVWSKTHNFLFDEMDHGSFEFNELGITVSKQINDKLHLGIQFFSRDQGDVGNNDVEIDWAYADYHLIDSLGFRVGKLKMSLGLYNDTRDIDILRTCIFLPQSAYLEYYRDVLSGLHGIGLYGSLPFDWGSDITYQIQTGTLKIDKNGGVTTLLNNEANIDRNKLMDVDAYTVNNCINGMLIFSPYPGLRLASSFLKTSTKIDATLNRDLSRIFADEYAYAQLYYSGLIDTNNVMEDWIEKGTLAMFSGYPLEAKVDDVLAYMYSVEWNIDRLLIMFEYYHYTYKIFIEIPETLTIYNDDFFTEGYYANAVYRFNDYIETGLYYSCLFDNGWDKAGDRFANKGENRYQTFLKDLSLSVRFDLNQNWTLKLENHWMNGTAFLVDINNPGKHDDLGRYWHMFAAKMTFQF
jgi:hypothetical protein